MQSYQTVFLMFNAFYRVVLQRGFRTCKVIQYTGQRQASLIACRVCSSPFSIPFSVVKLSLAMGRQNQQFRFA
jgi:hypothetical protein